MLPQSTEHGEATWIFPSEGHVSNAYRMTDLQALVGREPRQLQIRPIATMHLQQCGGKEHGEIFGEAKLGGGRIPTKANESIGFCKGKRSARRGAGCSNSLDDPGAGRALRTRCGSGNMPRVFA